MKAPKIISFLFSRLILLIFLLLEGMTGWWQVNGRSDKPMHLHTEEDLYYVQNYSIGLELQILVRTLWVFLRGKGAY